MIQKLLQHIQNLFATELELQASVDGVLPATSTATDSGGASNLPTSDILTPSDPTIDLYLGKFEINPSLRDTYSNQLRPQSFVETIVMRDDTRSYPLQKPPLRENIHCLVVNPAPARTLTEGRDFEVDWANSSLILNPTFDVSTAKILQLKYSTPGVFKLQEFEQNFWVDILTDPAKHNLEATTSLIIGTILTAHDELIHRFNHGDPAQSLEKSAYSSPLLSTHHTLNRIDLLEGTPIQSDSNKGFSLHFKAIGQYAITRTVVTGETLIKTIEIIS